MKYNIRWFYDQETQRVWLDASDILNILSSLSADDIQEQIMRIIKNTEEVNPK